MARVTADLASERDAGVGGPVPETGERTVGVLGVVTLVCSMAVLLAVGIHSTGLGPDPYWTWAWEDGDQGEDLWAQARAHDRLTAVVASFGAIAGWLLVSYGRPAYPTPHASTPDGVPWLIPIILVDVATLAATVPALGRSLTLAGAVLILGSSAAGVLAWLSLRSGPRGDRRAWLLGGALGMSGLLVLPVVIVVVILVCILLRVPSLLSLLILLPACLPAYHWWRLRALHRSSVETGQGRAHAGTAVPSSDPAVRPGGILWSIAAPGALAVVLLATWAAWPVPAPPSDAVPPPRALPPAPPGGEPTPAPVTAVVPTPTPTASPMPAPVPSAVPACAPEDLLLRVDGFDSAMGDSAARILATNTGDSPCGLRGRPTPAIQQGGGTVDLRLVPAGPTLMELTPEQIAAEDPAAGAVVGPGESASAALFWPGYRNAADQTTPQSVSVALAPGDASIPAPVQRTNPQGWTIGPAPFDLKHDMPGGAEMRVGVWTPRTTSGAAEG